MSNAPDPGKPKATPIAGSSRSSSRHRKVFDYATIDPTTATEARACATRIRKLGDKQNEAIVAIGEELKEIKGKLGHGKFGAWLDAEFGMSAATAERYMAVAERLGDKIRTMPILNPTTLYRLAARSTPAAVRDEIVAQVEAGEVIGDAEVGRRIAESKRLPLAAPAASLVNQGELESGQATLGEPLAPIKTEWAKLTLGQRRDFLTWATPDLHKETRPADSPEPDAHPTQPSIICAIPSGRCRYAKCPEEGRCLHAQPLGESIAAWCP